MSVDALPAQAFPQPVPDRDTQPFWEGCRLRELRVQRCGRCRRWLWPPRPICSACQTPDPLWTRVAGDGALVSWCVVRPPTLPAYAGSTPFVILLVELDEGVRLVGYLVDDAGARLRTDGVAQGIAVGTRVALRFHDQAGTLLPSWTLAPGRDAS